jgi:hypothetical protein
MIVRGNGSLHDLPALGIRSEEGVVVAVGDGGTTATEAEQLAAAALLHLLVTAVDVLGLAVEDVVEGRLDLGRGGAKEASDGRLEAATSQDLSGGQDGDVAIGAVAAVVDGVGIQSLRDVEEALFVEVEGPEVVF